MSDMRGGKAVSLGRTAANNAPASFLFFPKMTMKVQNNRAEEFLDLMGEGIDYCLQLLSEKRHR